MGMMFFAKEEAPVTEPGSRLILWEFDHLNHPKSPGEASNLLIGLEEMMLIA